MFFESFVKKRLFTIFVLKIWSTILCKKKHSCHTSRTFFCSRPTALFLKGFAFDFFFCPERVFTPEKIPTDTARYRQIPPVTSGNWAQIPPDTARYRPRYRQLPRYLAVTGPRYRYLAVSGPSYRW